ncbi:hypothetical protein T4C_9438 [Trichinella pseudospiralis]|uniref:Uncharacterized protein n=1 Tax=Trichinella pseudospiralis TaxID=6337 RepID=A0A0V1JQC6_TRIPS|nr:hypothetical protein T4C_9438 [Trichinella pseudospiralis]
MQLIQKPMKYSLKQQGLLQYFIVLKNSIFPHFPAFLINMKKVVTARLVWLKYSLKQQRLLQYFFVFENSIFPHFPPFLINMKKVVTARLVLRMKNSNTLLFILLFHLIDQKNLI